MCCSHTGQTDNMPLGSYLSQKQCPKNKNKKSHPVSQLFQKFRTVFTHGLNRTKAEKTRGTEHSLLKVSGSLEALEKSLQRKLSRVHSQQAAVGKEPTAQEAAAGKGLKNICTAGERLRS